MLGAMGTGLLFERTGVKEYLKTRECLPLVSQVLQIIDRSLQGRKAIIIPSIDFDVGPIQADTLGLSLGNGAIKLYSKEDISNQLVGDAIHGLPGKIHILYIAESTKDEGQIDIADIESIIFRMKTRAMDASDTSKNRSLPEGVLRDRRQPLITV